MERQLPDRAAERAERSPGVWKAGTLTESKGVVSTCGPLSAGYMAGSGSEMLAGALSWARRRRASAGFLATMAGGKQYPRQGCPGKN